VADLIVEATQSRFCPDDRKTAACLTFRVDFGLAIVTASIRVDPRA
jgi:hypothetical protein